ncbi:lipase family protein [Nocardia sp. NPDC005978]|uniref:lipase family protein n=1 Tax=Nocardia sp. NPDC005978 TaxID=3156725 RepID=UPI0033A5E590
MIPARLNPTSAGPIRRWCAALLVTLTAVTAAVAATGTAAAERVPTPEHDSFYDAPPNLRSLANGTVLKSRAVDPYGLDAGPLLRVWQVQYRSSDADGAPSTGVVSIAVPLVPWTGPGPRPLLSYQIAEDSLGIDCTTSYSVRAAFAAGFNNTNGEALGALTLLHRGWAVVLPDYQGPDQRFLDGPQSAHGVLDGIRAARAFAPAGLAAAPVGLLGYSGGGYATSFAAAAQPEYAPELAPAGVAMGGLPADLIGALGGTSGTYSAGLGLLALSALDRIVPEANIPALLNERGRTALAQNTRACGHDFGGKYAFSHLDDYAASPGLATHPRITALANRFRLDGNVPGAPSFVWHSTGDDALPIAATDAAVAAWCGAGATVSYRRTSTPTHLVSALSGVADALHFLDDRFAGVPAPAGCS